MDRPGLKPPARFDHRGQRPSLGERPNRPAAPPPLAGWDRNLKGHDRDQADQRWRGEHHDWDRDAPWKHNPGWWRKHRGFRHYHGPRIGYFFIPDFGYILAPSLYQQRYWVVGQYLPQWFWRYVVTNYWEYGLPEPPEGCAWVWVDDDVALIDLSDGYIIDIVHNLW